MIAKRLKEARKRAKFTQEKLGLMAGIDQSTARSRISQYESGVFTPKFQTMCQFAKILDVPESYFYTLDDDFAEVIYQIYKLQKKTS